MRIVFTEHEDKRRLTFRIPKIKDDMEWRLSNPITGEIRMCKDLAVLLQAMSSELVLDCAKNDLKHPNTVVTTKWVIERIKR